MALAARGKVSRKRITESTFQHLVSFAGPFNGLRHNYRFTERDLRIIETVRQPIKAEPFEVEAVAYEGHSFTALEIEQRGDKSDERHCLSVT